MNYKKTLLSLLSYTIFNASLQAQEAPALNWQKCYGWEENKGDEAVKIISTSDGNHLIAGKKAIMNNIESGWLAKLDSKGNQLWEVSLLDNDTDSGFIPTDVIETHDGGFIVVGKVNNTDHLIVTTYDESKTIPITNYHGYFDYLIVKLDKSGRYTWHSIVGGSGNDTPTRIVPTLDGNYMVIGYSNSNDGDLRDTDKNTAGYNFDTFLVKIDIGGNVLYKKCIGGNNDDIPADAQRLFDGGLVIVGTTNSSEGTIKGNKGGKDAFIIKTDVSYNVQWTKTIGGSQNEEAKGVLQSFGGDLLVAINSNSMNQDFDFKPTDVFPNNFNENTWLTRINLSGDIQNKKIIGGTGKDIANSLIRAKDGNLLLVGYTNSVNGNIRENKGQTDVMVMKLNENFDVFWSKTAGGSADDEGVGVAEGNDGGIVTIATTQSFNGDVNGNHYNSQNSRDIWVAKFNQNCEYIINTNRDVIATNADVVANEAVITKDRVQGGSSIRYAANGSIDFTDGFVSEAGTTVEASLGGCSGSSPASLNSTPIQMKIKNECREGGMKFQFYPFTPNDDLSQYKFSIQNLDPRVPMSFSGNTLVMKNIGEFKNKNAYYVVKVSREGYTDAEYQGYTSTCDHDGNPLDCPENTHDLLLDKQYYKEGDTFTATWTGGLGANTGMQWFPKNVVILSQNNEQVTGKITGFPATIQAQPSFPSYPKPCHGAVVVVFNKEK